MTDTPPKQTHSYTKVRVSTPARLHLGFLDLNGSNGRKFGSIGLAVDSHHTTITVQKANSIIVSGIAGDNHLFLRTQSIIQDFYNTIGNAISQENRGVDVSLDDLIPEHAGFGSGTQLSLAIGTALCRLHNVSISTPEIAAQLGRGKRSGIGIATFDRGGFIVDGGLKPNATVPPTLAHHHFPDNWRIVLIMDKEHHGVHGQQEKQAFTELPLFPLQSSQAICHLTVMQLLPALLEHDISQFGDAITKIQSLIGDHFAPAQGGRYTSRTVAQLLEYARQLGHSGIAQSSWGPTGCVFVESEHKAKELVNKLNKFLDSNSQASFLICQANESGATIEMSAV